MTVSSWKYQMENVTLGPSMRQGRLRAVSGRRARLGTEMKSVDPVKRLSEFWPGLDRSRLIPGPPELTVLQRLRLVEIAHETSDAEVRKWALNTLERASVPPLRCVAQPARKC